MKKEEIVAKRYGRNLVVMIDGTKKTRVITTEEDKQAEETIKAKVQLFNKKNSTTLKNQILNLVDPTLAIKEKEEIKKKGVKKALKKEIKKEVKTSKKTDASISSLIATLKNSNLSESDVAELHSIISKTKSVQNATKVPVKDTKTPHRGEW